MEGFFYRAYVAFATSITPATAHGVPIKALIPLSEPVRKEDGTYTERVSETTPIPAEHLFLQRELFLLLLKLRLLPLSCHSLSPPVTPSQLHLKL